MQQNKKSLDLIQQQNKKSLDLIQQLSELKEKQKVLTW